MPYERHIFLSEVRPTKKTTHNANVSILTMPMSAFKYTHTHTHTHTHTQPEGCPTYMSRRKHAHTYIDAHTHTHVVRVRDRAFTRGSRAVYVHKVQYVLYFIHTGARRYKTCLFS